MDFVNATEVCALSLEKENQTENAESLRQKICNVISKNIHFKIRNNLTFEQKIALNNSTENIVLRVLKVQFILTTRLPVLEFLTAKTPYKKQKNKSENLQYLILTQHLHLQVKSKNTLQLFVNNKSLKLELISNFILPILFHHVFMES